MRPAEVQLYCSDCDSSYNIVVHWRVVFLPLCVIQEQQGSHTLKNNKITENDVRSCRFTVLCRTNLRKKPVKIYIWSIGLYGADTWTLRKVDQKYLASFEMWWRMMEKNNRTDRVKNEELLHNIERQGTSYTHKGKKGELDCLHLA
jgi:hypothetical protein